MACIYKITNSVNGRIYIGKSKKSPNQRLSEHFTQAIQDGKNNSPIHKAINKYGRKSFSIEAIVSGEFNEELTNQLEKHYIRLNGSSIRGIGYNMTDGGESFPIKMWTPERRAKKSIAVTGSSNPMYGRSRIGDNNHTKYKKLIHAYSADGTLAFSHNGVHSLARLLGVTTRAIQLCLNKKRKSCKGMILSLTKHELTKVAA